MATECWKKSGDHWFWLDSDGEMLTDSLVEDGDDYYYVNEAGAMVKNEWRELDNTDDGDDAADTCWYYLGANGKAVKAPSSGKTTFIKLLCRLYDPTEGVILLNGIDIRKYNYREYMSVFAVVFQDFQLLSCSLGENMAAGNPSGQDLQKQLDEMVEGVSAR